jgi:hypothetical protein
MTQLTTVTTLPTTESSEAVFAPATIGDYSGSLLGIRSRLGRDLLDRVIRMAAQQRNFLSAELQGLSQELADAVGRFGNPTAGVLAGPDQEVIQLMSQHARHRSSVYPRPMSINGRISPSLMWVQPSGPGYPHSPRKSSVSHSPLKRITASCEETLPCASDRGYHSKRRPAGNMIAASSV